MRSSHFALCAALLLALTLTACTPAGDAPEDAILQVTYAGGFVMPQFSQTTYRVTEGGNFSVQTYDANGTLTSEASKQLSAEDLALLRSILENVSALEPEYGQDLRGQVADAGYANVTVRNSRDTLTTTIDPNVEEAYPQELRPVRDWMTAQSQPLQNRQVFFCTPPMRGVESCYETYQPVCGDDNATYPNDCYACRNESVATYQFGECEDANTTGDDDTGGDAPRDDGGDRLAFTACDAQDRPQACTKEYRPVCGEVDTGIRCITAPCPSSERRTFGNACTACAEENVTGHWPGACDEMPSDTPNPPPNNPDGGVETAGRFMICDRNAGDKPADYSQVARAGGYECVDECPSGHDEYVTQIGALVCIQHIGQAEAQRFAQCKTADDCGEELVCIYMTRSTDNRDLRWTGTRDRNDMPSDALRCAPLEYQNYMLHSSGATVVDEDGQASTMIA